MVGDGKKHLIKDDAILYGTPPKKTLPRIACLLEDSVRRDIRHVRQRVNPCEGKLLEPILCDCTNRRGHDATAPESLSEPIANFRGDSLDVVMEPQTDSTDSLGVDLNREARWLCLLGRKLDPCFCVPRCIGVRKLVAKVKPNVTTVCVNNKRRLVSRAPWSKQTVVEVDSHVVSQRECRRLTLGVRRGGQRERRTSGRWQPSPARRC